MHKLYSLFFLIPSSIMALPASYPAQVDRVIDGDTIAVTIEIWPDVTVKTAVRVSGVDTPESRGSVPACEKVLGMAATTFTTAWLSPTITIEDIKSDKYSGRVVAEVKREDGQDLADALILSQHAIPYHGKQRQTWCE